MKRFLYRIWYIADSNLYEVTSAITASSGSKQMVEMYVSRRQRIRSTRKSSDVIAPHGCYEDNHWYWKSKEKITTADLS